MSASSEETISTDDGNGSELFALSTIRCDFIFPGGIPSTTSTWIFFAINTDSFITVNNRFLIRFDDDDGGVVGYIQTGAGGTNGSLRFRWTTTSSAYSDSLLGSTTYYIWLRVLPGTGSNGECDMWISTTGIKPQNKSVTMSISNHTRAIKKVVFSGLNNNKVRLDYFRIDNQEIGDMVFY